MTATATSPLLTIGNFFGTFTLTPAMEERILGNFTGTENLTDIHCFQWNLCGFTRLLGEVEIVLDTEDDYGNDYGHAGMLYVNGAATSCAILDREGCEIDPAEGEDGYFFNRVEEIEIAIENFLDDRGLL